MIINQDEKFSKTIATFEETYQVQDVFNKFIELFPDDWKYHKIAYSKFNRSKQFGRTIPLPKPEVSLKKMIHVWMLKNKKASK
ncbi:hypothetical protein KCTC32516_01118 [Polaribacter huanghezhanensis]|uniref:hypothetical protein n=1 Tax=Polaribacter huanghezhanensis TaxID=1354726 RepID=UPI002647D426|nr:hypothetical protein [Polaribacter huanghezhanensis]WKD85772.1 hypothetical protein KCTC32516_01118 [Polaribacter huanghezhanensis]